MDLRDISVKVHGNRSMDSVVINTEYWIVNPTNYIVGVDRKGRVATTYITAVLGENVEYDAFKSLNIAEGDVVLLSKYGVNYVRTVHFTLPMSNIIYGNVHVQNIIGRFKDGLIDLNNFEVFPHQVLCKEIKIPASKDILRTDENANTIIGEVTHCTDKRYYLHGKCKVIPSDILVGDKILMIDNTSTDLMIQGEKYIHVPEHKIVGKFRRDNNYTMDNLLPLENMIVMEEYELDRIQGSRNIKAPVVDLVVEDVSEVYNRDLFRVVKAGCKIKNLQSGDIVYANRDMTEYVIIDGKKYFVLEGTDSIWCKVNNIE